MGSADGEGSSGRDGVPRESGEEELRRRKGKEVWRPSGELIPGICNSVVCSNIYPRLSPRRRRVLGAVSRDFAEMDKRLRYGSLDESFAEYIISNAKLLGVPRIPSLVVFRLDSPWVKISSQYFFRDEKCVSERFQENLQIDPAPRGYATHGTWGHLTHKSRAGAWHTVGSTVITTNCGCDAVAYVGRTDPSCSGWRWSLSLPPPRYGGRQELLFCTDFTVVGRRVVKLMVNDCRTDAYRFFAEGSIYHVDSNSWSHITPLSWPADVPDRTTVEHHTFEWNNLLWVTTFYCPQPWVPDARVYHACTLDPQTRAWSEWNGTPNLRMMADAFYSLNKDYDRPDFVTATDETLFVIINHLSTPTFEIRYTSPSLEENLEWVLHPTFHTLLRPDFFYNRPKAWALEEYGRIVVVAEVVDPDYRECIHFLEWWILDKFTVYQRGAFQFINGVFDPEIDRFALIHTDI